MKPTTYTLRRTKHFVVLLLVFAEMMFAGKGVAQEVKTERKEPAKEVRMAAEEMHIDYEAYPAAVVNNPVNIATVSDPAALEEMQYMHNANRERDINDCMMQMETIDAQIQEITVKLSSVENSQITTAVKKTKKAELQTQKDELLNRKQILNEKRELLEKQNNK